MDILELYRRLIDAPQDKKNDVLSELKNIKPDYSINWVSDIFEKLFINEKKKAIIYTNIDTGIEKSFTYYELYQHYNRFINLLRDKNIKKGSNIYVILPAVLEQWYIMLGALKAGYTIIPTAQNITEYELKFRFENDAPAVVVSDIANFEKIERSLKNNPVKLIVGELNSWESIDKIYDFPDRAEPEKLYVDDVFIKYFTSGTTGMPKAVRHSAVLYPLGQLSTVTAIGIKKDYIHVNLSSPGWAKFAWSSIFAPLCAGATVLAIDYSGKLNSHKYLQTLDKYKVNSFCAPPTAWRQFIAQKFDDIKLENLKETVSAGEPLNGEVISKWRSKFRTTIRDFYGQSESTAMVANIPGADVIPGSMGKPLSLYNMKLLDENMDIITEPDVVGDIAVQDYYHNYGLFLGYSHEGKNKEVFRNNFYLTGDRAYFDDEGNFYFVSRSDDVIKSSDYRVGPFEVESAIIQNSSVLESAVVGRPDPMKYQLIKAYVVLKEGELKNLQTAESIYKSVKNILPRYKLPGIIEFTDELPKTISGKIKRNELRKIEEEKVSNGISGKFEFTVR
ncbi:MAG: AMP-binding protein [Ferroplasma sp.]